MLVLMYHGIGCRPAADDPDHLYVRQERLHEQLSALLRRGWRPADPESLPPWSRFDDERRRFLVTFDDGYRDTLTDAAPVLARLGVPSVCFVLPGLFGARAEWNRGAREHLVTADDALRLRELGVSIGSHSWEHASLPTLGAKPMWGDVHRSADALEELLGTRPRLFAHPFGDQDDLVRRAVASTGATHAFATHTDTPGRFAIPRVDVNSLDNKVTFALKVRPSYPALRHLSNHLPAARAALHHVLSPTRHP